MSQLNFILAKNEVSELLKTLMTNNEIAMFDSNWFTNKNPIPSNDFEEIKNAIKLTFWMKNDICTPTCSTLGKESMQGKFRFDFYKDPIVEFDNCFVTDNLMTPGRIFFKAGWIENDELRKKHINWCNRITKLFDRNLKKINSFWRISNTIENWVLDGGKLELGKDGFIIDKNNINAA